MNGVDANKIVSGNEKRRQYHDAGTLLSTFKHICSTTTTGAHFPTISHATVTNGLLTLPRPLPFADHDAPGSFVVRMRVSTLAESMTNESRCRVAMSCMHVLGWLTHSPSGSPRSVRWCSPHALVFTPYVRYYSPLEQLTN